MGRANMGLRDIPSVWRRLSRRAKWEYAFIYALIALIIAILFQLPPT